MHQTRTVIISVGGSIIAPKEVDEEFLSGFAALVSRLLIEDMSLKLILVAGGGGPARAYQNAYRAISDKTSDSKFDNNAADWIGVAATRLNAWLLKAVLGNICELPVVEDPTAPLPSWPPPPPPPPPRGGGVNE
ncbi:MAG: hypothetical protein LBM77_10320 [Spirochaetaceae bacterium]|nr:hypothetical protein [Spirochaetaceae bacterium]